MDISINDFFQEIETDLNKPLILTGAANVGKSTHISANEKHRFATIIDKLKRLVKYNDKRIEGLVTGGCGRFALYLHRHLAQIGIKSKIMCLDKWGNVVETRNKILSFHTEFIKQELSEASFGHVMLMLEIDGKRIYVDGYNVYEGYPERWSLSHYNFGYITYEQLSISVYYGSWSPFYNAEANDENVISAIKKFLK